MPKKSDASVPADQAVYLQVYVHKNTKKLFKRLFNQWQNQQIEKDAEKQSQNYFILDALKCLAKNRGLNS